MGPEIRLVCPAHAPGSPAELLVRLEQADGGALLGAEIAAVKPAMPPPTTVIWSTSHPLSCHDSDRKRTAQLARC